MRVVWFMLILGSMVSTSVWGDVVYRRGGAPPLLGEVRMNEGGVVVRSTQGVEHPISWDRVKRIEPEPSTPGYGGWKARSVELWRARSRVERDDTGLAEPLFQKLFAAFKGQTHETALVVAEGLLRCRLARGAQALSILPALEVARLRRAGITTTSYSLLNPVMDETMGLCPSLPPVWTDERSMEQARTALDRYDSKSDAVVEALAVLYRRSLTPKSQWRDSPSDFPTHKGVTLLRRFVDSGSTEKSLRNTARNQMLDILKKGVVVDWVEAWARYAVGNSFLTESGVGRRQRGVVHLLHLPARWGRHHPYLAGLALLRAAAALEDMDHETEAARLREEAAAFFPSATVPITIDRPLKDASTT